MAVVVWWLIVVALFMEPSFAQDTCHENKSGAVTSLMSFLNRAEDFACELKVNETRIVKDSDEQRLARNYKLTKTSEKSYVAEINLMFGDFREGKDKLTSEQFQRLSSKYRPQIRECLTQYNPYLRGPNGERLTIRLGSDEKIMQHIFLSDKGSRPNSKVYPENFDCATAIHEILHLMGLTDEYPEKQRGFITDKATGKYMEVREGAQIPKYDCRPLGPTDSVMSDHKVAVEAIRPTYKYEICACETKERNLESIILCKQQNEDWNKSGQSFRDCPAGTTKESFTSSSPNRDPTTLNLNGEKIPPKRTTLLEPAQFRFITRPTCTAINQHYRECSKFSYQTSLEQPDKRCDPRAEECKQDNSWLQ